ncbi:hypothetical protein HPB50_008102 [Hyalomma asiaticum]|uniref:Uncharacterized protein n=1 Tax=Hyalomma asiaticum TaxID=266040 RepID=A0ACB7S518_HYAAI|nr:hypothetical protein HPB50_008102 [Hyalomma asiaticum]
MPGHYADGEELPAADALDTDGSSWRQVYARSRKPASSLKKTSVVDTSTEEPQKVLASIRRNAPRPPPLPADDYKIVLRIRGGFNCADTPLPKLIHAILQAAALTRSLQDQYRINAVSNTILVSTPDSERTDAYFQIKTIKMDNRSYEVASHITDPSNTCKGVIRNVPVDHTAETIMSSLLDYDRLGLILTGRRMGATTSVLVTFRGTRVPYYINYQGGVIRCVPYRYRTEACNLCRTVGHRPDVCPSAPQSLCQVCGVPNPPHDHDCQPKCVVCQKDHPTGSPQCPQRYKPKPKPAPLLFEKDAASLLGPSTLSQNNQRGRSPSPTKRQERRSRSRSRSRRRNRSRSKSVYPDNGRRTGPGNQVVVELRYVAHLAAVAEAPFREVSLEGFIGTDRRARGRVDERHPDLLGDVDSPVSAGRGSRALSAQITLFGGPLDVDLDLDRALPGVEPLVVDLDLSRSLDLYLERDLPLACGGASLKSGCPVLMENQATKAFKARKA